MIDPDNEPTFMMMFMAFISLVTIALWIVS